MTAEFLLAEGRRLAESLMDTTWRITRASGPPVLDPDGELRPPAVTVYEGPGRLRFVSGVTSSVEAAQQLLVSQSAVLSFPVAGSVDVRVNDVATNVTSPADPALLGKRFRIAGMHSQSHATARRFPVELIS